MPIFLSEQESREFREPVAKFLAAEISLSAGGSENRTWVRMAQELELLGVAVPEEFGGLGFSLAHTAIISEELGRRLSALPFLASAGLATSFLLHLADPADCADMLPGLIAGTAVCTVALLEAGSAWDAEHLETTAYRDGDRVLLDGCKLFVQHGLTADRFLVVARWADEPSRPVLCLVEADADGLARSKMTGLDESRPFAELNLKVTPARVLGSARSGDFAAGLARAVANSSILLSAEAVGAAAECLRLCVGYAKVRRQFDHPIGSFQAVQHRLADMYGELESARAAVEVAAGIDDAESDDGDGLVAAAAVARARSAKAFTVIARETIQIHGGIGFTWEHPAHRYFKRSLVDSSLLGDPAYHRRLWADSR